jgi:NAD(P)H-flavin reductase
VGAVAEHRLLAVRWLSPSAYVLRLERGALAFEPGQYVTLGVAGSTARREYSIYSGSGDPYLEVLIKQVEGGEVSHQLARLQPGAALECDGPFGYFTIPPQRRDRPLLCIASGTGIAPFHSFVRSYPRLDYRLLHGVRTAAECYDSSEYPEDRYRPCLSRAGAADAPPGSFRGRVTDYLHAHPVAAGTACYLCGNSEMIFAAFDIVKKQGIVGADLFAEVYF